MFKFDSVLDKIGIKELSDELVDKINSAGQAALVKLNSHISDATVHVTSAEKDNWNAKAPNKSPNFTGEPTAPTPVQSTNNDQLATTRYVTEKVNNYTPEVANTAKKLVTTNTFSIKGAINSSVQNFDGSNNVVMVVDEIPAKNITGTIDPSLLDGTYNINITGNAATATNSNMVGGYLPKDFAKINNPTFTGIPKVPTADAGDASTQIANTTYVTNAIKAIKFPEDVKTAEKLKSPTTIKISGKATAKEVSFDGSAPVDLNITSLDISDQLASYMPTKVNNHTVDSDVPINAVFTDTVYVHPNTTEDLTGQSYTQVVVDKQGHVVHGENPKNLQVSIAGNAATANRLKDSFKVTVSGDAITTAAEAQTDGQNDITLDVDAINASAIVTDSLHRLVTDDEKKSYSDKYTKAEIDGKLDRFKVDSGFDVIGSVDTVNDIATSFPNPVNGSVVFVKHEGLLYRFNGASWKCVAEYTDVTTEKHGLMTAVDKVKLDGIEEGANNYTLPEKLPASMITEDETHKFITTVEKTKLDDLYTKDQIDKQITNATPEATVDKAGLLSAADKIKLDGIETGANKYVLPKTLPATIIAEDEEHRFTTDTEKASYADKYTKVEVNTLISNASQLATHEINGWMRSSDKVKLDGIEEGANNYRLPDTLPASMITEDETHQFVTSTDKTVYADKYTKAETRDAIAKATPIVTTGTDGLMSAADKAKLDGIAANANKYVLPSTLPASMITEDVNHRFVTDQDKSDYADKYTKVEVEGLINAAKPEVVTEKAAGLMSAADKAKLDGIEVNANKYVLPKTLPATMITEDKNHRFVTDLEKTTYLDKYTKEEVEVLIDAAKPDVVTEKYAGLMSAADKAKLDGIAANANKYVLPSTLPASMITDDVNHRFVTDAEKTTYLDKYTKNETTELINAAKPGVVTQTTNGIMTASDKAKLDGIEANANNYVLPDTLPASMITEDDTHKFVTTDEKDSYADKYTKTEVTNLINAAKPKVVTQTANGLMAASDKAKLDGIAEGANNYVLPDTLPATMITEDDNHKFVTTDEKTSYADKYTKAETTGLINAAKPGVVTQTTNGLMASTDKVKLDGIEEGANNYRLPDTLPASMITEDETHKFVTTDEKASYADKYTKTEVTNLIKEAKPSNATAKTAGLMSADDKAKLDGIAANANNYTLPDTLPASMITEDNTHKFVTTDEKVSYADKYTKNETTELINAAKPGVVTQTANGLMAATDKVKLDGIAEGANNYVLPSTLPASMITTTDDKQFISNTEKASYADKYTKAETQNLITTSIQNANTDGMIWQKDVDSFSDIATTYPNPKKGWTVSVNDTGKIYRYNGTEWISLSGTTVTYQLVTSSEDGLMAATDKVKLDGIAEGANNYVLPDTLPATMITTTDDKQFISNTEKASYADKYTKAEVTNLIKEAKPSNATTSVAGLMSADDKAKLDGIAANANNYVLPETLPASMITEDDTHKFVTTDEKTSYADKYTKTETTELIDAAKPGVVTEKAAGLMSASDKAKLDGIAANANNYTLPETLPATMITTTDDKQFISNTEKISYADKYTKVEVEGLIDAAKPSNATTETAGLMSASDKAKLDGIAANANKYVLPSTLPASMITTTDDKQFISNTEKTTYADKYTKAEVTNLIKEAKPSNATAKTAGLMSADDKAKLDGIAANANKFVLPSTLPASMITTTDDKQFISKSEKASYADKYTKTETTELIDSAKPSNATTEASGLMSAADKAKLDGIAANANNYVLPDTLPASMITEDETHKFVTTDEKTSYADKYTKTEVTNLIKEAKPSNATTATAGLMSAADKAKLDGIEANANKYVLPNTIPASMVETSDDLQFVSKAEKASYADKYSKAETVNLINQHVPDVVTTKTNGLMIAADKTKLDGIEANANNYVLPETLPATMITEDETHKFVTTDEKSKIANVYTKNEITKLVSDATPAATDSNAGLMSAADKAKLDGIAANANNYVLPKTLPASMITTTTDKQFISNTEKTSYADKYTKAEVDQKLTDIASGNINLSTYTRYKGNISAAQLTGSEEYSGKIEKDDLFFQDNGLIVITKASDGTTTTPEYQRLSTLSLVNSSTAGLMSAADKAKLDGIAANANKYVLPSTLPASMITEDSSHKFVTTAEKTKLDGIATVTTTTEGLMSAADKVKLNGIEAGANKYVLPKTLPASMITEDNTHKFVTSAEKTLLSNVYTKAEVDAAVSTAHESEATAGTSGLMSAADKAKLDSIESGANRYVLPDTLPASMIATTSSLQFISSAEKAKIGTSYTKAESDAKYMTKIDSSTDELSIGNGWEIKPNSSGNLEISYNGVVKFTVSTDGKIMAPNIIEGTDISASGTQTLNEMIAAKASPADVAKAIAETSPKVYDNNADLTSLPANTALFFVLSDHASA